MATQAYHRVDSQRWRGQRRWQKIAIPGLNETTDENGKPLFETAIYDYEFQVKVTTLHWHVTCPQVEGWSEKVCRIEVPPSDLWLILESFVPDLLAASAEDYLTAGLPETSEDKGLGEGNGLKSGVDY